MLFAVDEVVRMLRFTENPLITPRDVRPSRDDFQVVCVFNAGCIRVGGEILLLLRVAERPAAAEDEVIAPMLHPNDVEQGIQLLRVPMDDPDMKMQDSRVFEYKRRIYLTSISHFRVARSTDGRRFTIEDKPAMAPARREEEYGIEDARITRLGDDFYINYSAISRYGISTGLAVTRDFKTFERRGIIFPPDNRDVTIFPEKINGRYVCYHRPIASFFGRADMWMATSPDLIRWGDHRFVLGPRHGEWDALRIGGGAVPFRTEKGWLEIYHAADATQRYCLGAFLADLDDPGRVLGAGTSPILAPDAPYEREGFFGNVVFTCGCIVEPDRRVIVYYGAADECIAAAETSIDELLAAVGA